MMDHWQHQECYSYNTVTEGKANTNFTCCQGIDSFYELFAITEFPNNELTSIHTRDLSPLLL